MFENPLIGIMDNELPEARYTSKMISDAEEILSVKNLELKKKTRETQKAKNDLQKFKSAIDHQKLQR